jgi:hypothetical protein
VTTIEPTLFVKHPDGSYSEYRKPAPDVLATQGGQSFSPVMLRLVKGMREHGGEVVRHPGGFWCCGDYSTASSFGASTVEALVRRKAAEYVEWNARASGFSRCARS